ncbi:hypothetical protein RJ639_027563 [Escallonia herrerae]|uniref:Uncharacterized protein n=1 Tax=Escallonia herrerae TaxID=1293975 RepID=A0AA88XB10_9ASTE|nr:hypothetical protein RJ639_027563 [Escallonia herrerae]
MMPSMVEATKEAEDILEAEVMEVEDMAVEEVIAVMVAVIAVIMEEAAKSAALMLARPLMQALTTDPNFLRSMKLAPFHVD